MAASSPSISSNATDAVSVAASLHRTETPPKTLRGLNKPKCIQCGNVARSRCPYQSCKSCCSKAQNPCHIHVLKAIATVQDKTPTSSSPSFDQQPSDASSAGSSHRAASLRQLSSNFAQFNNLHVPLRSKKPLTRKDAQAINEWRFSKLKEHKDRNIEVENEAFDRYMQNVGLLEEVFSVKSILESSTKDDSSPTLNSIPSSEDKSSKMMTSSMKLLLRSNQSRTETFRKRIKQIVEQGLENLRTSKLNDEVDDLSNENEDNNNPKRSKSLKAEKASVLSELIDKLNKARNIEDLTSCVEMKSQVYNQCTGSKETDTEGAAMVSNGQSPMNIELTPSMESDLSSPKLFRTTELDQETLNIIDAHFSSIEQIEDL